MNQSAVRRLRNELALAQGMIAHLLSPATFHVLHTRVLTSENPRAVEQFGLLAAAVGYVRLVQALFDADAFGHADEHYHVTANAHRDALARSVALVEELLAAVEGDTGKSLS